MDYLVSSTLAKRYWSGHSGKYGASIDGMHWFVPLGSNITGFRRKGPLAPGSWRRVDMFLYLWFWNKGFKGPWSGVILQSRIPLSGGKTGQISTGYFHRSPVAEMWFDNKKYDWKFNFFNLILLPDLILLWAEYQIQIPLPQKHHTRHQNH